MANIKSAKRRIKTNRRNYLRRRSVLNRIKDILKAVEKAISAKKETAKELVKKAISMLDKAQENNILHKNTVARKKSRIQKKLNKLNKP